MKRELLKFMTMVLVLCLLFTSFPAAALGENESGEGASVHSGIDISTADSMGEMIADELGEETGESNGVKVFSVEVKGNVATAEFETTRGAELVVGVYTEDGATMLGSGRKTVTVDDKTAEITIEIDNMPRYFYLRAFMIDERTLKPLCRSYECPNYTRDMQEFFGKATADFAPDRLLIFDESADNNFAVYKDSVILIGKSDSINTVAPVDEQNKIYRIQNADESVRSLAEGNIIVCENGEHGLLVVKISAVSVDGTTVTVAGGDVSLGEVFDFVRIEGSADLSTAKFKADSMDSDVRLKKADSEDTASTDEISAEGSGNTAPIEAESTENPAVTEPANEGEADNNSKKAFAFERLNEASGAYASGSLELSAEASVKVFLTPTKKYVELSLKYSAEIDFALDFDGREELSLGEFSLYPVKFSTVGIEVSFAPVLVLESNGSLNTSGTLTGSLGLRASNQGVEDISRRPEFTSELHKGIRLFVGLKSDSALSVHFLPEGSEPNEEVSARLSGESGIEFHAVSRSPSTGDSAVSCFASTGDSAECLHECSSCVAGRQYYRRKNSVSVHLCSDDLNFTDESPVSKIKLRDFYYSETHDSFGWTTCPYIQYRVDVTVTDENNRPVSGAEIGGRGMTDDRGNITFYLPNGSYRITAAKDGKSVEKTCKINNRAIGVLLTLPGGSGDSSEDEAPVGSDDITAEEGASHGAVQTMDSVEIVENEAKTVTFNGCKPNAIYNFYSLKVREDGLDGGNLLYLCRVTADANGSVTITYTGREACENPAEFLTALEEVNVADVTVESADHIYNGSRQYYQPVLKSGGYELCEGIDYTVRGGYFASEAGKYMVEICGWGVFTGKRIETFVIASRDLSSVNVDSGDEFLYCGSEIKPEMTLSDDYCTLDEVKDYEITFQNNREPGTATAEITGKGNYTGSKVITFEILYCDIGKNSVVELDSVPQYSGEPITPDLTLTVNGNVLEKDTDYTLNYQNNINKGSGIIEINGLGGYKGSIVYPFDILECDLGEFGNCAAAKYILYNGSEQSPKPVVTANNKQLAEGIDYTVEYSDNTFAGTATITVTGIGNYGGTLTSTFEIVDKQMGDVNVDDKINVKDVTAIQRSVAEYEPLNEIGSLVADINDDGRVSVEDASRLKRILCEFSDVEPVTMEEPEEFTWKDSPLHGKIKTDNRSAYSVDFDVSAYKNKSVNALYVSPDGSDSNSGTADAPLFSMKTAYKKGADTIYLLPGIYTSDQTLCGTAITRSINIIGLSEGEVILSTDVHSDMKRISEASYVWSVKRSGLSNVIDLNNRTSDGYYTKYQQLNTPEDVAANEGSWAFVSGVAYVHTIGGIEPTEENGILLLNGNKKTPLIKITAGNLYLENLICLEGSSPLLAETNNNNYREINVYGKNSKFFYSMTINNDVCMMKGVSLAVFQNCEASFGLKDGFNYHTRSGIIPKAVEINCRGIGNGNIEDGNDQGSTIHDGGSIIRVGDVCAHSYGSNYAEQGTGTESWNIDCIGYESYCAVTTIQNADFFAYGNTKVFCDGCAGFGSFFNVNNSADKTKDETPGEIYLRNDRFTGTLAPDSVEPIYY